MHFEYTNTKIDALNLAKLSLQKTFLNSRYRYYYSLVNQISLHLLAIYLAYNSKSVFLICVFGFSISYLLYQSLPYSKYYWNQFESTDSVRSNELIRLEVKEDGLLEDTEGIQSFVPWTSVCSFTLFQDTLFIELRAKLWAVIPRRTLTSTSDSLDDMIRALKEKGVSESTFKE